MDLTHFRPSLEPEYAQALGTAVYCFALCEWNALYCADRLQPGSLNRMIAKEQTTGKGSTAGQIATRLGHLARNMAPGATRERMEQAAAGFDDVVKLRNRIMHGKPGTGPNDKDRLGDTNYVVFEVGDLAAAIEAFNRCAGELADLYHGPLASYRPRKASRP